MGKLIKTFLKNLKDYLSYLMKVGFGDLLIQFLTLVIILLLSCFIYVPIGLIEDIIISAMGFLGQVVNDKTYQILDLVFKIISFIFAMFAFMYLFNKRYDDIQKLKNDLKYKGNKQNNNKKREVVDIELPKEK